MDQSGYRQCPVCNTWTRVPVAQHVCQLSAEQAAFREKYGMHPQQARQVATSVTEAVSSSRTARAAKPKPKKTRTAREEKERSDLWSWGRDAIFKRVGDTMKDILQGMDDD